MNLKVKLEVGVELERVIYASHAISLQMAAGAYRVVTLCAQLVRDPLAIAKFFCLKARRDFSLFDHDFR